MDDWELSGDEEAGVGTTDTAGGTTQVRVFHP